MLRNAGRPRTAGARATSSVLARQRVVTKMVIEVTKVKVMNHFYPREEVQFCSKPCIVDVIKTIEVTMNAASISAWAARRAYYDGHFHTLGALQFILNLPIVNHCLH